MENIYNLTKQELEEYFLKIGSKKFHADQLFSWLYEKRIKSLDEVTNIKKEVLEDLSKEYTLKRLKIVDIQEDEDVSKYLFE